MLHCAVTQSNMLLLCFSACAALVCVLAAGSTTVMYYRWQKLQSNIQTCEPTSSELAASRASDGEAACYVTSSMLCDPRQLLLTRPGEALGTSRAHLVLTGAGTETSC